MTKNNRSYSKPSIIKTIFMGYLSLFGANVLATKYKPERNIGYNSSSTYKEDYSQVCKPLPAYTYPEPSYIDDLSLLSTCLFTGNATKSRADSIFSNFPGYVNTYWPSKTTDDIYSYDHDNVLEKIYIPSLKLDVGKEDIIQELEKIFRSTLDDHPKTIKDVLGDVIDGGLVNFACGNDPAYVNIAGMDKKRKGKDIRSYKRVNFYGYGDDFAIDDPLPVKSTYGIRHVQVKHKIYEDSDIDTCNTDYQHLIDRYNLFARCVNHVIWNGALKLFNDVVNSETGEKNARIMRFNLSSDGALYMGFEVNYNYYSPVANRNNKATVYVVPFSIGILPGTSSDAPFGVMSAFTKYLANGEDTNITENGKTYYNIGQNDWEGCAASVSKPSPAEPEPDAVRFFADFTDKILAEMNSYVVRKILKDLDRYLPDLTPAAGYVEHIIAALHEAMNHQCEGNLGIPGYFMDQLLKKGMLSTVLGITGAVIAIESSFLLEADGVTHVLDANGIPQSRSELIYATDPEHLERYRKSDRSRIDPSDGMPYRLSSILRFSHDEYIFNYLGFLLDNREKLQNAQGSECGEYWDSDTEDLFNFILIPGKNLEGSQWFKFPVDMTNATGNHFRYAQREYNRWKREILKIESIMEEVDKMIWRNIDRFRYLVKNPNYTPDDYKFSIDPRIYPGTPIRSEVDNPNTHKPGNSPSSNKGTEGMSSSIYKWMGRGLNNLYHRSISYSSKSGTNKLWNSNGIHI